MDKNMINIDEYLRQRLEGGEESPRSGAWLNMRQLLDENLPLNPPKQGFNWRGIYGLIIGLIVLTSASIGGYQVLHRMNENPTVAISEVQQNFIPNSLTQSIIAHNPNKEVIAASTTPISVAKKQMSDANKTSTSYTKPTVAITSNENSNSISSRRKSSTSQNQNKNSDYNNYMPSSHSKKQEKVFAATSNKEVIKEIAKPTFTNEPITTTSTTYNNYNSNNNNTSNANITATKQTTPLKSVISKDTFNQLQVVQRFIINPLTRESRIIHDTVAVGKIALDKSDVMKFDLSDNEQPLASTNTTDLDQTLMKAGLGNQIVPLANLKIRSHKTTYWNARSFNEVVNDVKFNISQIKFYPGISVGFNNYILKTTAFNGFHFGFAGLFTLDNWALMTELKYFNRINSDYTINDSYVESAGAGLQQKVDHFFKLSSIQSIEMPLAMRYTVNRLNIFAGFNTTYVFGVNPEEVTHTNQPEPIQQGPFNAAPSIEIDDFNNRFGIGGLMGVSYDLLPSMQLDLRATRNVWDNKNSRGGLIVARELFRVPSFQVSFTYRFSQKTKFPKAK